MSTTLLTQKGIHNMENISYNLKFATLCAKYNLGLLMNEPEPITGGLLHRMYRLQTDKAQYAVKALNPQIMQRDTAMSNYIFLKWLRTWLIKRGSMLFRQSYLMAVVCTRLRGNFIYCFHGFREGITFR